MKYNIEELRQMYKNNEECIKQINIDIDEVKNTLDYYKEKSQEMVVVQQNLLKQISQMENEEAMLNQGVTIDYKLFSEILSVLTTSKQCNLCTQEFFDRVIEAGKNSENQKETQNNKLVVTNNETTGKELIKKELPNEVDNVREIDKEFIEELIKKAILKSILSHKTK